MDRTVLWNLAIALLCGLSVGAERQWSGHASGRRAHLGGLRTFGLLGLVSGLSGWLWTAGLQGPAIVLLAGLGALVVVAYLAASKRDIDGTTDVAAFIVIAAGLLAGTGHDAIASGVSAVTLLLLIEKRQLHGLISKIDPHEMRAGVRFAVMAAVVLPILPEGPFGPLGGIRPRHLWMFVLLFSGISFLGYVARRSLGRDNGYAVAGALGGIVSSTATTVALSRISRSKPSAGRALASGAMGASTVLFPRVLIATTALAPLLTAALWPAFVAPIVIGVALFLRGLREKGTSGTLSREDNPLQFKAALQMALLFQAVLFAVSYARGRFGDQGVVTSALLLGLFDVDALTISMTQLTTSGTPADVAARAVTVGVLANTLVKLGIALVLGRGAYRPLTGIGLALMAATLAAFLYF